MSKKRKEHPSIIANPFVDRERILHLGLTGQEAMAWIRHDVVMPWVTKGTIAIVFGSVFAFSMLTPLGAYFDSTLTTQIIVQNFVFVASGFLLAYGTDSLVFAASRTSAAISQTYSSLSRTNFAVDKWGIPAFMIAALLIAYWQMPGNFNAAGLNEGIHSEMHLTFLVIGGVVFVGSKSLTKRMRGIAPVIVAKALGGLGTFLLVTPKPLYAAYSLGEQVELGTVMVVLMLVMDATIVPYWLYGYFSRRPLTSTSQ